MLSFLKEGKKNKKNQTTFFLSFFLFPISLMCCCYCCVEKWLRDMQEEGLQESFADARLSIRMEINSCRKQITNLETTYTKSFQQAERILFTNENNPAANFFLQQCTDIETTILRLNQEMVKLEQLSINLEEKRNIRINRIRRRSYFKEFLVASLSYFNSYRSKRDEDEEEELLPVAAPPPVIIQEAAVAAPVPTIAQQPASQPAMETVAIVQQPQPQPVPPFDPHADKLAGLREGILRGDGNTSFPNSRNIERQRAERRQIEQFNQELLLDDLSAPTNTISGGNRGDDDAI